MSKDTFVFKRVEKKYLVSQLEKDRLITEISDYLIPDRYGKSTICSVYLDTPDFLIIRNSIEAKAYKEKLRLRCYGTPNGDDKVFFEIKKKYKGVVYKRRISLTLKQAYDYLSKGIRPEESQIMNEIEYAMKFYRNPKPSMLISYERDAFYVKNMPNLRLTFDTNLRYRTDDLFLENGGYGKRILQDGNYILEIKTDGAMPIWLSHALSRFEILPSSFSKYGTAYRETLTNIPELLTV